MSNSATPSRNAAFLRAGGLAGALFAPHASVQEVSGYQRARLLAILSLTLSTGLVVAILYHPSSIGSLAVLLIIAAVSYALSRTKFYNLGALSFSFGLTAYAYVSVFLGTAQNLETVVATTVPVSLIMASAILGRWSLLGLGIAATLVTFMAPVYSPTPVGESLGRMGGLVLSISAILYCLNLYRARAEQARLQELDGLNRELEAVKTHLTVRVEERTLELSQRSEELALRSKDLESVNARLERRARQFEAISEVSRSIISIRDLQNLLPQVNAVISRQFGFYHVGIFLLDEAREYAVLSAANSEGGQRMLARKHRLRIGQEGIVGYVTATGQPRVALDVGADAVFFNNPDLPDTHSEMALPLKSSGQVLGALDVQSTETDAFSDEDVQLLSVLADQVSLAIENALLFEATHRSLAEAEAFSHQYLREGWNRLGREQQVLGYRYDIAGAAPLSQPVASKGKKNETAEEVATSQVDVPIQLRGEVIGQLVVQAPAGKKWTSDELDLIRAVAERVALSAENARLFEETNRRAERERMVSEITSKIRSSNDPNEMIRTAVQELKSALGVSRVEVVPQRIPKSSGAEDA